jgi:Fe-S cluster biogenesis protein NfuA/nitrite reductase/ring-hydroxylating ferredoxin subunit
MNVAPEALVSRVEELTARLETIDDPTARECADELAGALMALYGEGLERIMQALDEEGDAVARLRERLVGDGVVASLMLIHGLYPVDLETRVREALDSVRPYMESHGGDVELLGVADGVARLRLEGHCRGCAASASTLELAIKQAIEEAAPDLLGLEVDGVGDSHPPPSGFELPMVGNGVPAPPPTPAWLTVEGLGALPAGGLAGVSIDGAELVVANVDGSLLAYRNACAACGARLDHAALSGGTLSCPSCGCGFALPLAGRSTDGNGAQLQPIPLLREGDGGVRVALGA